jgi:membrane-associated phospholipid phosphatase
METSSSFLSVARSVNSKTDQNKRQRADSFSDDDPSFLDKMDAFERDFFHIPLQSLARSIPGVQTMMTCFGLSCTGEGLVCGFGLLCWTISVKACITCIWLVPIVEVLNGLIKWQFGRPRPGWNDPRVEVRATSHEYSFPSSHAMLSWSLFTFFAHYWWDHVGSQQSITNTILGYPVPMILMYGYASMVSISRVFDGAHYPHDILIGGYIGRQIGMYHYTTVYPMFEHEASKMSTFYVIMVGMAIVAGMLSVTFLTYLIAVKRFGQPKKKWSLLAKVKNDDLQPQFVPLFDYVGMCGVFAGLSFAEPIFDYHHQGLVKPTSWAQSLCRLFVGLTFLVFAWFAVRAIEKSLAVATWQKLFLRFCRYAQVPPIILLIAPPLFQLLGV